MIFVKEIGDFEVAVQSSAIALNVILCWWLLMTMEEIESCTSCDICKLGKLNLFKQKQMKLFLSAICPKYKKNI